MEVRLNNTIENLIATLYYSRIFSRARRGIFGHVTYVCLSFPTSNTGIMTAPISCDHPLWLHELVCLACSKPQEMLLVNIVLINRSGVLSVGIGPHRGCFQLGWCPRVH